jgi:hypothetical protein
MHYLKKLWKKINRLFLRWPADVEKRMSPVVESLRRKDYKNAGTEIAYLSLDICRRVEKKDLKPKEADKYFTYLINLMDLPSVPLDKDVKALILEGNALHGYGTKFGADLERMRKLANGIIGYQNDAE